MLQQFFINVTLHTFNFFLFPFWKLPFHCFYSHEKRLRGDFSAGPKAAARLTTLRHQPPILAPLQFLPVKFKSNIKMLSISHKAPKGQGTVYTAVATKLWNRPIRSPESVVSVLKTHFCLHFFNLFPSFL